MSRKPHRKNEESSRFTIFIKFALFTIVSIVCQQTQLASCETKEFDWSDLGVSLSGPKSSINSASPNSQLRILVSPQRRLSKNYELEYSNVSQPASAQGETSYVIPGSGHTYLSQSGGQVQSQHNSAYSALSASLASLKSRLNARSATLGGPMSDSSAQSNLYPNSVSSYGSSMMSDQQQPQAQSQSSYLSMSSQIDQQQPSNGYSLSPNQSNDNKTIVLAIPAKINFLTEGRSSSSGKQQQPQQVTVIQQSNEQQTRPEYSNKQIGMINGHEVSIDQSGQNVARDNQEQEHPQYVIVNSPQPSIDQSQLVASNLGNTANTQAPISVYSGMNLSPYAIKYVSSNQQAQKMYNSNEQSSSYEPTMYEQSSGCLDSCNSADVRWRKYTVSKYKSCCSRSPQYDTQFDTPSSEGISKQVDDSYYSYLYRKARGRRSRKLPRSNRNYRYNSGDEENSGSEGTSVDAARASGRTGHYESPYVKRQRSRLSSYESADGGRELSSGKDRSYRRSRSRDLEAAEPQPINDSNEDEHLTDSGRNSGYGSGEYSVENSGRYPNEPRPSSNDEEESQLSYPEDSTDLEITKSRGVSSDGPDSPSSESAAGEGSEDSDSDSPSSYSKYNTRRRRKNSKGRSRKNQAGKESKHYKKGRKAKSAKQEYQSSLNGTDHDVTQPGDQYHQEPSVASDDEQSYPKDASYSEGNDSDKDLTSLANKYRSGLNETAVAHLSKTTMHLKEILSILEKKANLKANESLSNNNVLQTTPAPVPTTTISPQYPSALSQYSSQALQNALNSEYLSSEMTLKSPYRFESSPSSLSSSSLSLPSSYSSLTSESYNPLTSYSSSYSLPSKQLHFSPGQQPRKKRVNKHLRYNNLIFHKTHGFGLPPSMTHPAGKHSLMNPTYYASLQHPYWYTRGSSPSVTNSYPYKSMSKSPYSSLTSGPLSSKLAAAASSGLYSDDARFHGYDPISHVASSLRPSTTMRLRSKPFVFQPHVSPIYTRHTILTPLDVKK